MAYNPLLVSGAVICEIATRQRPTRSASWLLSPVSAARALSRLTNSYRLLAMYKGQSSCSVTLVTAQS